MRAVALQALVAVGLVVALAAPAFAKTITVGKNKAVTTITDAVAMAAPGDKIVILKGRYHENVVVQDLDGLTIQGKGKPIWDGGAYNGTIDNALPGIQDCLRVFTSDKVVVKGIDFRNGGSHVFLAANATNATIQKCRSRNPRRFVECEADGVTVDRCTLTAFRNEGIEVEGDGARITRNRGSIGDNRFLDLRGNDGFICRNTLRVIEDGAWIDVTGNNTRIVRNSLAFGSRPEIELDGNDGLLENNRVRGGDGTAFDVNGERMVIRRCRAMAVDGDGIEADGFDIRIEDCVVLGMGGDGIDIDANMSVIRRCRIIDAEDHGIRANGDDITIDGCVITDTGDEFIELLGDDFDVRNNRCEGVYDDDDGFRLRARGNREDGYGTGRVENNKLSDVMETGIYVRMDDGLVRGNTVQYCGGESTGGPVDPVNEGTGFAGDGGFDIGGNGNDILDNRAMDIAGDGFYVNGSNNEIRNCKAMRCDLDGFDIDDAFFEDVFTLGPGGNLMDRCQAVDCNGEGLDNGAPDTTLTNSKFSLNSIDIAIDSRGGGAFLNDIDAAGNKFDTGGATTEQVYGDPNF